MIPIFVVCFLGWWLSTAVYNDGRKYRPRYPDVPDYYGDEYLK